MRLYTEGKTADFKYAVGETDIYGRTFHDTHELYLLLSGTVEFIGDNIRAVLAPYDLVLIPRGRYHQFKILSNIASYERCVFNIRCEGFTSVSAFDDFRILRIDKNSRAAENFRYLTESLKSLDYADTAVLCDAIAAETAIFVKNSPIGCETARSGIDSAILEVMVYINESFADDIDVSYIAERFHLSVSSLCHRFSAAYGIGVKKYIIQKRMSAAMMKLKSGVKPEQVSVLCGYANYSAFYRAFVGTFGVSPSDVGKYNERHIGR